MILVCHVSNKTPWSKSDVTLWLGAHQVLSYYPAKFGGLKHCGSEDIMI